MNAILDNQIRQLGFWSAVIFLVTVVVSLVLPLDVPNGLYAEHADRVIWLNDNRSVFILGWVNQMISMLSLCGVFLGMAWYAAIRNPLRGIVGGIAILLSITAFIIPKFIAIWTIPQLAEVSSSGGIGSGFADQLLLGLIVSGDDNEVQTGATMRTVYGAVEVESESIIPTLKYKKQNLFFEGFDASLNASYNITQTRNIDTLTGVRYNWYGETFETISENNGEQGLANLLEQDDNEFNSQLNLSYLFNEKHSLSFNHAFQHFKRDEFDEVNLSVNEYYLPKSLAKNVFGLSYKYKISKDWTASVFGKAYVLNVKASEQETNNVESTIPVSVDYSDIGYGMTTSYFLFKNLQLKASYEKAFRLPTAEEFFGDGLLVLANPNLKPEQSDNFNFGINFNKDLNENNQIEVGSTFIYRNAKDLIYNIVSVSSPTSRSGNLAETKALGVQGTFAYRWKDIFNLSANITYQDITDEADLIYNDFSGYTDIAIGAAMILGFKLPVNFNKPYFATSPSDFWRRWHISLSSWLRDYLYIPLGGNKKSSGSTYLNLIIVMFLGGLWHGASWNFVIWGLLHGLYLAIHKMLLNKFPVLKDLKFFKTKTGKITSIFITQYFIFLAWIPFTIADTNLMFVNMQKYVFLDFLTENSIPFIISQKFPIAIMGFFVLLHLISYRSKNLPMRISKLKLPYWILFLFVALPRHASRKLSLLEKSLVHFASL